jgi:hypothetical protein
MKRVKCVAGAVALGAAMPIGGVLAALPAQDGYIVTLTQQGPNVVANGSGPINLTGLTLVAGTVNLGAQVDPNIGIILTGQTEELSDYNGFRGPVSFGNGSGGETFANSGTGDEVGIEGVGAPGTLFVPLGYVSDSPLSDVGHRDIR